MYRIFVKRNRHSIYGLLTVMDTTTGKPVPGLHRLKIASGQWGYTATNWSRAKSPCPLSKQIQGNYRVWTNKLPYQRGEHPGKYGIGEFWPISADNDRLHTRKKGYPQVFRTALGIHMDNSWPGSAGCVVMVYWSHWQLLRKFLMKCHTDGLESLELIVFY